MKLADISKSTKAKVEHKNDTHLEGKKKWFNLVHTDVCLVRAPENVAIVTASARTLIYDCLAKARLV